MERKNSHISIKVKKFQENPKQNKNKKQKKVVNSPCQVWLIIKLYHFGCWCRDVPASQVVLVVKNLPAKGGDAKHRGSTPGSGRFPWRRAWQPTPVLLPKESHGQRSLAGYGPPGHKELDRHN